MGGGCSSTNGILADVFSGGLNLTSAGHTAYSYTPLGHYLNNNQGCDISKTALIQSSSQIVATAIVLSIHQCNSFEGLDQQINIGCHPQFTDPTEVYEQNPACGSCNSAVFSGMMAQHALERQMWDQGATVHVRTPIDQEFTLVLGRLQNCGTTSCKACALTNVTQYNVISQNSQCFIQMANQANFQANLTNLINQTLLNNQDVLSGVADQLQSHDMAQINDTLVTKISSYVNETFLTSVVQQMQSQQVISINASNLSGNNISQYTAFTTALNAVTTNNIVEQALGDAFFSAVSQIANDQNTLNEIGEIIFGSTITFTKAISNAVGQIMLASIVLLAVVIVVIAVMMIVRAVKKSGSAVKGGVERLSAFASTASALPPLIGRPLPPPVPVTIEPPPPPLNTDHIVVMPE